MSSQIEAKRAAMVAHESQIAADSWFLTLPPDRFAVAFGEEHFIRRDATPAATETELALA